MEQNQTVNSFQELLDKIPDRGNAVSWSGFSGAEKAFAVSKIIDRYRAPILVVLGSPKEAEVFEQDLLFFRQAADNPIIPFPAYHVSPVNFLAYHNETAARRVSALYRIMAGARAPVVISVVRGSVSTRNTGLLLVLSRTWKTFGITA